MNGYKKALDSELGLQTSTKWELEHQTKRTTEYEARIAKMKADIAALKEELPKNGEQLFFTVRKYPETLKTKVVIIIYKLVC